ncbi:BppU family phage baseplate upper protein [Clostridium paraputrificum]|uniref:BppU family phage baseplate upper protein n=1 Tax=Clostridium paraputrificum TaxID=29363 RepID=UPI000DD0AE77|nr:BppU family phage baseplate upper protein [Clostridium paraputrificum]
MKFLRKINLEINKDLYNPIQVKQNDTARYLLFNLLDNGVPFSLENKTVRVYGLKPDGTKVFNNLTIINAARGLAELQLTTQMLVKPGCLKLELVIYEATDILSTTKFDIDVIASLRDDAAIESTNEFSALTLGLSKLDEWDKYFKETSGAIEEKYTERLSGLATSLEESTQEINKVKTEYAKKTEVSELTKDKATINYVNDSVARLSSGTPLFASSLVGMTDTTRNYVNTTDGYLYIYNGNVFVKSTVKYQELGLSDRQVTVEKTDFAESIEVGTSDVILNDLFTITGQLSVSNGVLKTGVTTSKATDFIDISNVKYLFRYVLDGSSSGKFKDFEICFYTKEEAFVSGMSRNTDYTVEKYGDKFGCYYPIPHNAEKVRFSCSEANCIGGSGNLYTYLKVESVYDTKLSGRYYENYIEEQINNSPTSSKPWQGKNVGVFSDSIWGNFRDETGIASIVAKNTGATVYNFGFGGTRMSGRNDSNSQDQYWDKFSFCRIVDYIETGDFSPMRNALSNMSSALSYFSEVITMLEETDWTKIDIIFIAYGTNDFTGQNIVYDNDNPSNLYCYNNAYRYALEKLLTLYPHLRVILITPAWRFWDDNGTYLYDSDTHVIGGQKLYDFVECAEKVAKDIHIPVINIYDSLGANKYTRSQYFKPTDGTHHHENGRLNYGNLVSHKSVTLI